MIHEPFLKYCGLTIVLSKPSRLDFKELLSGTDVSKFLQQSLSPFTRYHCDIRTVDETQPFLNDTKVIILAGYEAQQKYLRHLNQSLDECRGYTNCVDGKIYISTYFPQDAFDRKNYELAEDFNPDDEESDEGGNEKEHSATRRKNYRHWLIQDFQKALQILKGETLPISHYLRYKRIIYPNSHEFITTFKDVKDQDLFFDIETNENYHINCFSITYGNTCWTVPIFRYTGDLAYSEIDVCKILRMLNLLFNRNRIIIHNSLFDLLICAWRYKVVPPHSTKIYDTMIALHRLYPESEKSFGHLMSITTHEPFHKNEGVFSPKNREDEIKLWDYNGKDSIALSILMPNLQARIKDAGLEDSVARANRLVRPYLLQSLQGINIDSEWRTQELDKLERLKIQYLRISKLLIGYDIETLGSWQRVSQYLYDFCKFPKPPPSYRNGIVEYDSLTGSETLYKLQVKMLDKNGWEIPFVKLLLKYRAIAKELGFLKFQNWTNLKEQYRGYSWNPRFTSGDRIAATDTYRNASSKLLNPKNAAWSGWGSNKQNLKKKQRRVCIPDSGNEFVQSDQSGAEALVVAYLAPKGRYRTLFENKIKSHTYVALHLFQYVWEKKIGKNLEFLLSEDISKLKNHQEWHDVSELIKDSDDWPASERYYYIAKMVCHASNYGMKGPTFQTNILKKSEGQIVITRKRADFFLNTYHSLFPEIHLWHHQVIEQLDKNRTLYNLFGDRRIFFGHWNENLWKAAYAFVPQSTVGMLTNIAISEIQQEIDEKNPEYDSIDILANGHDSILSQCPIGEGRRIAKIQEKHLAKTFFQGKENEFTMRSSSAVGMNWKEMKEIK